MTTDELMLINPLDGDIEIQDNNILEKIEDMIQAAIDEKNCLKATNICAQLVAVNKISGLALAKSLYMIRKAWLDFPDMHDNFDDVMSSRIGLHRATIQRYTAVWGMYDDHCVPAQYEERIKGLNIKSQIPIAQAIDAGYEIEDENWEVFANATDHQTVAVEMRKLKGKEPRPQAIVIMMDRDGGLKAMRDGDQVYIGWLNKDDESHLVQQTIRRICTGSGILEQ